jgi:hypothetical protein
MQNLGGPRRGSVCHYDPEDFHLPKVHVRSCPRSESLLNFGRRMKIANIEPILSGEVNVTQSRTPLLSPFLPHWIVSQGVV